MKIGVDIRVLMDKNYSGVSRYLADLLTALFKIEKEKNSPKNNYFLFYNSFKDQKNRLSVWENDFSQIRCLAWPNKIFNYLAQRVFRFPKLDILLNKPDVFWLPHFNFSAFSRNSKTKKVITVHDLSFLRYPEFFSWRKNFWHKALGIKKMLQEAQVIIAVSENTKYDLIDILKIKAEKIKVIHSGFSPLEANLFNSFDKKDRELFFKKHKLEAFLEKGFILYLGNIEPRKNLVNLIKAYELWRRKIAKDDLVLPLVLAGAKGWKTRAIFSAWQKSNFKNDIFFLSYVNDAERELLYSKTKLFIYPSFYEGFGLPPLEAMARSLPVITSNISSLPEVVADSALMIDPNDPLEMSEAITLVLEDENLRQELIKRGLKRVESFSWEKTALEYLKVFSELNTEFEKNNNLNNEE